jgi:hypothetical protein
VFPRGTKLILKLLNLQIILKIAMMLLKSKQTNNDAFWGMLRKMTTSM